GAGLVAHEPGEAIPVARTEHDGKGPKSERSEPGRTDRFGDPLPPGALARMGTERLRHPSPLHALAFSPEGAILIAADEDQPIRLWDRETGKEIRRLTGHKGAVTAVAISPDGKTLASASRDQLVLLWDLASGKELHRCAGHAGEVWSIVFSPD